MRRRLLALSSLIAASLAVLATPAAAKRVLCVHGIEAGSSLPVRASPSPRSSIIAQYPATACGLQLIGKCVPNGWCRMAYGGRSGWIDSRRVGVYEAPAGSGAAPARAAIEPRVRRPVRTAPRRYEYRSAGGICVAGVARWDTLRIRRGPGVGFAEIGGIPPGACGVARAGSCYRLWCRIAWRGREGWVNTYYLARSG